MRLRQKNKPDSRASKGGHDDGIGGNIRVIKFRNDGGGDPLGASGEFCLAL